MLWRVPCVVCQAFFSSNRKPFFAPLAHFIRFGLASMRMTLRSQILRSLLVVMAWLLLAGFNGGNSAEDTPETLARQIKAAYIFKFANYIEWPASCFETAQSPIVIGVAGADRLASELTRTSQNRLIGKRPVVIKRLTARDPLTGVHILYVGGKANRQLKERFSSLQGQPLLSVTDATHELADTAAIKFVMDNNQLRFDISQAAVERNHLKVMAPLLTVARRLDQQPVKAK